MKFILLSFIQLTFPFLAHGNPTSWDCETSGFLNGSLPEPSTSSTSFKKLKSFSPLLRDKFGLPIHRRMGPDNEFFFKVRLDKEVIVQLGQSAYPHSPYQMEKRDTEVDPRILHDLTAKGDGCPLCNQISDLFNCFEVEGEKKALKRMICHDFMILQLSLHPLPHYKVRVEISSVEHRVLLLSCNDKEENATSCLNLDENQEDVIQIFKSKFNETFDLPPKEIDDFYSLWVRWVPRDFYVGKGPMLELGGGPESNPAPDISFDLSKKSINEMDDDKHGWLGKSGNVEKVSLIELFKPIYWTLETRRGVQNLEYKIECLLPRLHGLKDEDIPLADWPYVLKGLTSICIILGFKVIAMILLLYLVIKDRELFT